MGKKKRVRKKGMSPSAFTRMFMDKLRDEMLSRGMCSADEFDQAMAKNESEVKENGKNDQSDTDRVEELLQ